IPLYPSPTLFPYTTLFRSVEDLPVLRIGREHLEPIVLARPFAELRSRQPLLVILRIHLRGEADLLQVREAARLTRLLARLRKDRSEEHTSELQSPYDLVCR